MTKEECKKLLEKHGTELPEPFAIAVEYRGENKAVIVSITRKGVGCITGVRCKTESDMIAALDMAGQLVQYFDHLEKWNAKRREWGQIK